MEANMCETDLNYRGLFLVLSYELKTLMHYFSDDPKYQMLLEVFSEYREDEYNPIPKQKDLLDRLGLSRTKLMDLLRRLHHDFRQSIFQAHRYSIKKTEYYVSLETLDDRHWQIGLDHLEHIPSRGEVLKIPFTKGELTTGYLKVKEVHHTIEDQVHTVVIFATEKWDRYYTEEL